MLVDEEGTGRKICDDECFLRRVRERAWLLLDAAADDADDDDDDADRESGVVSPKTKNLMNAPSTITTDSWPTSSPCRNEKLARNSIPALANDTNAEHSENSTYHKVFAVLDWTPSRPELVVAGQFWDWLLDIDGCYTGSIAGSVAGSVNA